ncbi:MAG: LPS export ABC transporter periplasmic protein LptC [Synechococcaceae cyanobacterium]|nr:LPS export ABC transporter periplasmic protein LptC [Synechococcaceae cyanobacterium]
MSLPSTPSRWLLLALLLPALGGCAASRRSSGGDPSPPFVFRALDLRQQDARGNRLWDVTSPEARYDLRRRLAQASDLRGTIYRDGQPRYRVMASSGIVVNDGEVIQLEGRIRLEQIGDPPAMITASRIRWLPSRKVMELDRHPRAYDNQSRLIARTARFHFDSERLELQGQPLLQRWPQPFNPLQALPVGAPDLQASVRAIVWYPRTGQLQAQGPLRALRQAPAQGSAAVAASSRPGPLPPGGGQQLLTANGLRGDTVSQRFELLAPVTLVDAGLGATLKAPGLQIDLRRQDALTADRPGGCRIDRPGESLQARRCLWNWGTQTVQAQGEVLLRRQANDQITRAELLQARLGQPGFVVLQSPGARVVSRFRVPAGAAKPAPVQRSGPEPIRL